MMLFSATKQTSPSGRDTSDDEYLPGSADEMSMFDESISARKHVNMLPHQCRLGS